MRHKQRYVKMRYGGALFFAILSMSVARAAPGMEKAAILILPPSIAIGDQIKGFVEFRWSDDAPVTLNTWTIHGELSTLTNLSVFDESGKKVNWVAPVSLPIVPNGTRTVSRGETLKLRIYTIGWAEFEHPGHYYAVAEFSWAESAGTPISFTTKKCWFDVTGAKPKAT
jgi:hypothetical protein